VEIGSNDGYLINHFNQPSTKAIGVDTSADMCKIAQERGVDTVNALFGTDVGAALEVAHGPASVIMANNVFNHANDPVGFAKAVADLLAPDGVFVFEVPYWGWMVTNGKFPDMTYHEHPTYFTIKMAQNVLAKAGLSIASYELVNYHGQSLRVVAHHSNVLTNQVPDWETLNTDQGFLGWLQEVDPVYGLPRQAALTTAYEAGDVNRVATVFNTYKGLVGEPKQTQQSKANQELRRQVAPPRSRSSTPPTDAANQRIYTQNEIAQFYDEWRRGLIDSNDAVVFEKDIHAAATEGRIR
jgi:SAM-dependent methyltransferase